MEVLAFFLAIIIGISLGLIGGGGSILTVPVLVYLLGINPVLATAYSLFVVGTSALIGALQKHREKLVNLRIVAVFAVPALIAVYLTRLFLVPAIPDVLFNTGTFTLTKDIAIMVFFGVIMLLASVSMIRSKKNLAVCNDTVESKPLNYPIIIVEGFVVGALTGIVGAGGGFLIIPALVLLARLPMKEAVGTSLLIIAIKSLIGFIGDVQGNEVIDWQFLLLFTSCSVIGIFAGNYLSKFISGQKLKKGFGWFVLIMAVYIITKELIFS